MINKVTSQLIQIKRGGHHHYLKMARKVLITGASGLLGRAIFQSFTESTKWEVLGLAYSRAGEKLRRVDLCDRQAVEKVLEEFQPDVVIHSAAERRPDVVEKQKEKTVALNVSATETLASLCSKRNTYLLYISTDYVFDGKNPPYAPNALTNPLNAYGISKRDGETVVLKYSGLAVLRVPVLYGPVESLDESAVTILFKAVQDTSKPAKMSDYEQRYPTHVANCAQVCVGLAEKHLSSEGGISAGAPGTWHFSGKEPFTKYTMALAMADVFGLSGDHLTPVKGPSGGAVRPFDCHLDSSSTEAIVPIECITFREGIKDVLQKWNSA